ncbi:hypothetical protein POTOM_018192 [Populus tomentosa]|uniref:NIF system FeS cluster assembly NifU C-terminal domain-containing protein n=1 Tax=Populus tomentosa TaxID=118781 RepID=A0A8X7ZW92_POPTO|nr:hypothetical protein POTOM_018192 [Populus tomentosa]
METPMTTPPKPAKNYSSSVDSSRPFRSVREAVAIFGERFLVGEIYSPKPYYTPLREETDAWRFLSPSPGCKSPEEDHHEVQNDQVFGTLKKLEAELEETKAELKLLKERESETEIALASLNAELHMNLSKLAEAEAAAAKKAAESTRAVSFERKRMEDLLKEEERRRELTVRMENFPTLAQILNLGGEQWSFRGKKERKVMKKKPIVPLVGDLFFKKKVVKAVATPDSAVELPLTADNVESVLDEVRPYLISDGGNVALHEIDGNVVRLKLQGACSSCSASVTTMKMGIERRLMEKIPEIVAVEAISDEETGLELNEENIEKVAIRFEGVGNSKGGSVVKLGFVVDLKPLLCSEIGEFDVIPLLFLDGSLQLLFLRVNSLSPASYILPLAVHFIKAPEVAAFKIQYLIRAVSDWQCSAFHDGWVDMCILVLEEIRPYLVGAAGGSLELVAIEEPIVKIRITGPAAGVMTVRVAVTQKLREKIPAIAAVQLL